MSSRSASVWAPCLGSGAAAGRGWAGGLQLEAQLGLPCGFFDQLFYRGVRRGSTGFWGVGVFDAKQVAGAVEIAEDETYVMPSSSFAGFSPYRR